MMAKATTLFIETIITNKDFAVKLKKFFDRFFKDIDEAANRIPGFLQVTKCLLHLNFYLLHHVGF